MSRIAAFLILVCFASVATAQTHPTTMEIRHGIEMPATTQSISPVERQEMVFEQLARKVEPDLKGNIARLPAYREFAKQEFVRDPRLFGFDVSAKANPDGSIELNGFVEFPAHEEMLDRLLHTLGFEHVEDRTRIAANNTDESFGVVNAPRSFVFDRTTKPSETLTEVLFGEPVFILRAEGDFFWIHTSDGYVGFVNTSDIAQISRDQFTKYQAAQHAVLRQDVKCERGDLPAGSFVAVLSRNSLDAQCFFPETNKPSELQASKPNPFASSTYFDIRGGAIAEPDNVAVMQKIEGAILTATKLSGTKYVWGGRTDEGIDCSGLVQMAFKSQGINLPRDADQQAYVGRLVALRGYRDAMVRGDLMFFISRRGSISHTAIYLGDNQFIEAADKEVKITSLNPKDKNYDPRHDHAFAFARRVIE